MTMKNFQKGFIVPMLLVIIVLLLVGGGMYVYKNKKTETPTVLDTATLSVDTQTAALTENDILTATYFISANILSKTGNTKTALKAIIFPNHTTDNTDILSNP